jgi:hypothetical protein
MAGVVPHAGRQPPSQAARRDGGRRGTWRSSPGWACLAVPSWATPAGLQIVVLAALRALHLDPGRVPRPGSGTATRQATPKSRRTGHGRLPRPSARRQPAPPRPRHPLRPRHPDRPRAAVLVPTASRARRVVLDRLHRPVRPAPLRRLRHRPGGPVVVPQTPTAAEPGGAGRVPVRPFPAPGGTPGGGRRCFAGGARSSGPHQRTFLPVWALLRGRGHHQLAGTPTLAHPGPTGKERPPRFAASGGPCIPALARPLACQSGCHLAAARVKGAAVLASLGSWRPCGSAYGAPKGRPIRRLA